MATNDLITVAEAKTLLRPTNAPTASYDTELALYITAASQRIDDLCGPVVIRTITNEAHDGGRVSIFLKHYPVVAITTITEYAYTTAQALSLETTAAKTANDYLVTLENGIVRRRSSNADRSFAAGSSNVVVTYTAGRYANTAAVEAKFKLACSICVAHMWRNEQGFQGVEIEVPIPGRGYSIPRRALDLIQDEIHNEVAVA